MNLWRVKLPAIIICKLFSNLSFWVDIIRRKLYNYNEINCGTLYVYGKGVFHVKRGIHKRIIAIFLIVSVCVTLLSVPAIAVSFPYFAKIDNTTNGYTGVYSQPGTTGHEKDEGTKSERLTDLLEGRIVKILGTGIDGDGDMWYKIGYGDSFKSLGYVYEKRVTKVADGYVEDKEFENWLTEQGFPESYKDGLRDLHSLYPNWKFYADHTGLDFNAAVKAENGGVKDVDKYIHVNSDISWKVYEKGEYNWETGRWTGHDGDSWIKTTDQVVAYYLDPRNFLDETNVFMFANESFDAEKEDLSFVQTAVKGTFMDAVLPEHAVATTEDAVSDTSSNTGINATSNISSNVNSNNSSSNSSNASSNTSSDKNEGTQETPRTYAHAILKAAKQSGVSSATIVAVICQEQGSNGIGKCISGVYSTAAYPKALKGYYNFFNIGAYAHSGRNAIENGLIWAKGGTNSSTTYNRPWNTREKAIIGGATWYGESYIKVGQNTIYYKNFNVYKNTEYDVYTHQYATNIEDCVGKGSMMAQGMSAIVDEEIVFHIPVYKNMPKETTLPAKGTNNNRFLKSLSVEGYKLSTTFNRYTYSYEVIVPYKQSKVKINAVSEASDATVTGGGEVKLAVGNNDLKIVVTASSGLTATYNLTIYREKAPDGEAEMPELNTKYKIGDYMTNIQPDTSIATFKKNLGVKNGKVVVMDSLGNEKKDGLIATGDKVHLYDANEKIRATYRVVIYGDVDGNGKITSVDLLVGQNHILKKKTLVNIYVTALDIDGNGKVNSVDLLVGQRHVLKIKEIDQKR